MCTSVNKYQNPTTKFHGVTTQETIALDPKTCPLIHILNTLLLINFSRIAPAKKTWRATLFINLSLCLDILWEPLIHRSTFHHFTFRYSITETDTIFLRLAAGRHHEMELCYKKLLGPQGGGTPKSSVRLRRGRIKRCLHVDVNMCVHQHSKDSVLSCTLTKGVKFKSPENVNPLACVDKSLHRFSPSYGAVCSKET